MATGRITYQNWIVEIGQDPNKIRHTENTISLDDPDFQNLMNSLAVKEKDQDDIADLIRLEVSRA